MKSIFTIFSLVFFCCGTFPFAICHDPISDAFLSKIKELSREQSHEGDGHIVTRINEFDFEEIRKQRDQYKIVDLPTQDPALPHPKVRIENGLLIGETVPESHAFYSIPYAKPPTGPLRFQPPEPAEDFGQLNASVRTLRMCWQTKHCDSDEPNCTALMSEDCLVLNVNVPARINLNDPEAPPIEKLPVLVYFYGGFFYEGYATTPKYDGRWLSKAADAVIVTVNYRVGTLGFLSFEDEVGIVEGNQGIKDQQLALQWVQKNIAKFGGDTSKVTLFGNSAGSQSIIFHYTSAKSKSLFARGIVQSSPTVFQYQTHNDSMNTITRRLLNAIGCSNNFTCLRTVDPEALIDAKNKVSVQSLSENDLWGTIEPFRPVIGSGTEFSDQPLIMFQKGLWHTEKEIIIGDNDDEMSYIRELFRVVGVPLPKRAFKRLNDAVVKEYGQQVTDLYSDYPTDDRNFADNFAQEITDMFFACPNRALARFAVKTSTHANKRVYLYNLAYALTKQSCIEAHDVSYFCGYPFHASEVIFVFKSAQAYGTKFYENDTFVSDMFTTYWGGFARNGDPSSGLPTSLGNFTHWPVYSNESDPVWTNIRLDFPQSTEEYEYRKKFCDVWDDTGFYFNDMYPIVSPTNPTEDTLESTTTILPEEIDTTTNGATATIKNGVHNNFTAYLLSALVYISISLLS